MLLLQQNGVKLIKILVGFILFIFFLLTSTSKSGFKFLMAHKQFLILSIRDKHFDLVDSNIKSSWLSKQVTTQTSIYLVASGRGRSRFTTNLYLSQPLAVFYVLISPYLSSAIYLQEFLRQDIYCCPLSLLSSICPVIVTQSKDVFFIMYPRIFSSS